MFRSRSLIRIALAALVAGAAVDSRAENTAAEPAAVETGVVAVTAIERLSENADGVPANAPSTNPVFSPDGRHVAFETAASNLIEGDGNRVVDIYVRVLKTGRIVRASVGPRGEEAVSSAFFGSTDAAFAPDGRSIVFASDAANFVPGAPLGSVSLYLKDLYSGTMRLVSTSTRGAPANGDSTRPVISRDGRIVAFMSTAANLDPKPGDGEAALFVKDLGRGRAGRASLPAAAGAPRTEVSFAHPDPSVFSKGGRAILFSARLADPAGERPEMHVYLRDLYSGALTRISETAAGTPGDGPSRNAFLSPDGKWVAFDSHASNFVAGDTNNRQDGFMRNLGTGEIRRVTTAAAGAQINGASTIGGFTPDGTAVVFASNGDHIVPGVAAGGKWNVYLKDLATGATVLVSRGIDGGAADATTDIAAISADGRKVLLTSTATNLVSGRQSRFPQVYLVTLDR